jgi:hypothetical protein
MVRRGPILLLDSKSSPQPESPTESASAVVNSDSDTLKDMVIGNSLLTISYSYRLLKISFLSIRDSIQKYWFTHEFVWLWLILKMLFELIQKL